MMSRIALATAALMAVASPALAQSGTCGATGGPNGSPRVTLIESSWDTSQVPRMGPGSDLLTQKARVRNATNLTTYFTVTLSHRAFQTQPLAGRTIQIAPHAVMELTLGNILPTTPGRGLSLQELRASTMLNCTTPPVAPRPGAG